MNIVLVIASIITLIIFFVVQRQRYLMFTHINNLKRQYDKMEMYVIEHDIQLDSNKEKAIKLFKNLSVNPGFLDIQVLVAGELNKIKNKKDNPDKIIFKDVVDSFGNEFKPIFYSFDRSTKKLVNLSLYRFDFIWFLICASIKFSMSLKVGDFKRSIDKAKNNPEIFSARAATDQSIFC